MPDEAGRQALQALFLTLAAARHLGWSQTALLPLRLVQRLLRGLQPCCPRRRRQQR
jgi:hypothetical protein